MENSQNSASETEHYKFILFISGMSTKSSHAIENLRKISESYLPNFELQIIDIRTEQQKAVEYQILAVPTLIKIQPNPTRIIVGDLSDTEKVLRILDIK
ncbi:circadian clock KaiB family protein [uncultured Flavobacterium sp.]|uniref:circadian clock KaiB family protein n=1 Tax=uncultured Flavobacterium sp. TaxID=165435 RepID=UPI0025E67BFF|nr:circadian clock KaiB family protein [uncultured Flavobacterium sp.]